MSASEAREFYVSMQRCERTAYLAGPFTTHTEALILVDSARREACAVDAWAHFDAFGTCSLPSGSGALGKLNDRLGIKIVNKC